jgi:hypothetical protein
LAGDEHVNPAPGAGQLDVSACAPRFDGERFVESGDRRHSR